MIAILLAVFAFQAPNDEEPPKKIITWADRLIAGREKRMQSLIDDVQRMQSGRTVRANGEVIDQTDDIKRCQKEFAALKAGALPLDLYDMPFQPTQYDIGYISKAHVVKVIDKNSVLVEFVAVESRLSQYKGGVRKSGETVHTNRVVIRGVDTISLLDDRQADFHAVFEATGVDSYAGKRMMKLEPFDSDQWIGYIESRSGKKPVQKKTAAEPKKSETSPEVAAANKLKLTKAIKNANPSAYKVRLQEIIEKYPDTEAAKEAAELLGK